MDEPEVTLVGKHIGPHQVVRLIGEGGFGTVYLARQQEPIRRRVALKVIKAGLDTNQAVARFQVERQALALMDHPDIAKVFDAGATEAGRPYFVMELVSGVPITEHCDRSRLSIRERLDLFTRICRAVQHAHQKGIIHRDLKPSNILIAVHDGVPAPKIIDFGIAKATDQALGGPTFTTRFRQILGTPEYASPEQIDASAGAARDIDTRSDTYSLGVLLYELLTGTTPFDRRAHPNGDHNGLGRFARDVDPLRPSQRVHTLDAGGSEIAEARHRGPAALVRVLRGDLDWITMKALEKERTRRYDTAAALADDVERHLRNEAVLASPPGSFYRFRKLVARQRIACAAVVAVFGFGIWTYVLYVQERRLQIQTDLQLVIATTALSQAEAEAETALQVSTFLADLFAFADSRASSGEVLTVRELLNEGVARIDRDFPDRPVMRAALLERVGRAYTGLQDHETASTFLRQALAIRRQTLGAEDIRTVASMNELGRVLMMRGELAEAEELFRDAMAIGRSRPSEQTPGISASAVAESLLGSCLTAQGRYEEAEAALLQSYEHLQADRGGQHRETQQAVQRIVTLYEAWQQDSQAAQRRARLISDGKN